MIEPDALLAWYRANERDLPWRRTKDPYAIWVSEIMCQQTQVGTVIPYFERWMARFPTLELLAAAEEEDVLSLWQGLGYYRRANLLHEGAKKVLAARLPTTSQEWQKIPGVGLYTSGAIASIAYNEPIPAIDGNVERVYSRLENDQSVNPALNHRAREWSAGLHAKTDRHGDLNQALMEFGATICTPRIPKCDKCSLANFCKGKLWADSLPTAVPKKPSKEVTIPVTVIYDQFGIFLERIPNNEWWAGLWRCPKGMGENLARESKMIGTFKHVVTNHKVRFEVFLHEVNESPQNLTYFQRANLEKIPLPTPYRKALKMAGLLDF